MAKQLIMQHTVKTRIKCEYKQLRLIKKVKPHFYMWSKMSSLLECRMSWKWRNGMGKLILVTGGARSGKSSFAEETVRSFGDKVLYIATAIAFDDEMKERIRRHRLQRPANWETLEAFRDFDRLLPGMLKGRDAVLLDCVTVMVSNIMLQKAMDWEKLSVEEVNDVEREVTGQVGTLLAIIKDADIPFILVTNELGMGVVPPYALGRAVRDIAGRVNQQLARVADEVYLCVSGIPVKIK